MKKETVFSVAALAALLSVLLTPPSAAYLGYVDVGVLILLLCLMAVVAGFRKAGVLDALAGRLEGRAGTAGKRTAVLTLLCFFAAMLLTNDVALLTFVPLTLALIPAGDEGHRIWTVVLQTVAANLGSLVTPVGNPQNLFLYHFYGLSAGDFFKLILPLAGVSLGLTAGLCLLTPGRLRPVRAEVEASAVDRRGAAKYGVLFAVCLLAVFHVISSWLCLAVVVGAVLATDRGLLAQVDWLLLATFVCFFVFVGNLSAVPAVSGFLSKALAGRELLVGALTSQVISNVPAAVLLSPFTSDARGLLLGTNIGGLGTPVASLASLIAYRLYSHAPNARRGRYLAVFSGVNFALLAVLLVIFAR